MTRSMIRLFAIAAVGLHFGCADENVRDWSDIEPGKPRVGDKQFISAAPGDQYGRFAGAESDATNATPDARQEGEDREIEEADIIRIDGDLLYLLNAYRGLEILDISNPDDPVILGQAKVFGYPVEMYIDGSRAYVVVSNYFSYWVTDALDATEWRGSQIVIVDIENPALPEIMGSINIEGYISDTRRVGDVLYVVSNRYAWWSCAESDDNVNLTFVASIDIWDPANIEMVDGLNFPGSSNFIHVTQNAVFVAQYRYDWDDPSLAYDYGSAVTYVDISDAAGDITERDTVFVPGYLRDRFALDWFQDSFRIVTHFWDGIGHSELRTFDTTNADDIQAQGTLRIEDAGRLMATRFAGDRAYTIHLPQAVDPLDVIDLSDPTNPTLEAILEIPGWVNHLEVRGSRLLALGVDDTAWPRRVSVKLFDVTVADAPILLDEVPIGDGYSWSAANWDPKALTILDDEGLVLVPFTSWAEDAGAYSRGVAMVEWLGDDLVARGVLPTKGYVNRTRAQDQRIFALSYQYLEVFDVADLDQPSPTAAVELAWNVSDLITIGEYSVQLVGDYWTYWDEEPTRELRVVPLSQPDTGPVLARVPLDAPYGRLFNNGSLIYVASYDYQTNETTVQVFDLSDPLHPIARGSVDIEMPGGFDYYGGMYRNWGWWYYGGGEVFQLDGDQLVLHPWTWYGWYDYAEDDSTAPDTVDELWFISLADPDAPTATRMPLTQYASQVTGRGDNVYFTYYEPVEVEDSDYWWAAYYLGRVTLAGGQPTVLPSVNIPGQFIDASEAGSTLYTLNYVWNDDGYLEQSFNSLHLTGSQAELLDTFDFGAEDGTGISGLQVENGIAYVLEQGWGWYSDCQPPHVSMTLLDARQPANLHVASEFTASGYGYLMTVEQGRAFLNMGWGMGMMVLDIVDPDAPSLLGTFRTQGYPVALRIKDDVVYLPSGYYGVQMFHLSDATPL